MAKKIFIPLDYSATSEAEMIKASKHFLSLMKTRRTVRMFSDKPVPMEVIKNCTEAAATAPSGANKQPWHFVVVSNPEIKRKIRTAAEKEEREFYSHRAPKEWLEDIDALGTNANKPFLENAPYLIAVFEKKYEGASDPTKKKLYYTKESVGIATGILITALHRCGLVSLTYTPSPMNFLNEILNRPKNEKPFLLLVAGYPESNAVVPQIEKKRFKEVATFWE